MVWFLVDDTMTFHLKVTTAGNAAIGLWTRAGAWASFNRTDGYVPSNVANDIGNQYQIKNLLDAGLWSRVTGGYQFHDWADRQPSSDLVNQRREQARIRKQRQRQRDEKCSDVTQVSRVTLTRAPVQVPSRDLVSLSHQEDARARSGAAPPTGATPPRAPAENKPANSDDFYDRLEMENCPLCDDDGYRGNIVCDHIDRTQTHKNGIAQVRAALTKKPQPL